MTIVFFFWVLVFSSLAGFAAKAAGKKGFAAGGAAGAAGFKKGAFKKGGGGRLNTYYVQDCQPSSRLVSVT